MSAQMSAERLFWPVWTAAFLSFGLWLALHDGPDWAIAINLGFTVPLSAFFTWVAWRD